MLSVKEAARKLSLEQQTIRSYIRNGVGKDKEKLKAITIKVGLQNQYRIKNDDLENFRKKYLI